ncbi:MAG: TetR/AcrR family transcriptional regulator [bacterium]
MPRTKEQNKEIREKTKNLIIDSALKLFAEKGFHSTSMSDIAQTAGVSKGLAYNYFDSKQHIVEAILQKVFEMFSQEYHPLTNEPDPYKKLELLTNITFTWLKKSHEFWKMIFVFFFQPGILENSSKFMKLFYDEIFLLIESILKEIGVSNYFAEARIYGALLDGVALDYIADIENYPINEVMNEIKKKYSRENLDLLKHELI